MEFSKLSTRKLILAGAVTGAAVLGLGAYFAFTTPAESQVLSTPATAPASASKAASVAKAAPAVAKPRDIAASEPAAPKEPVATRSKEQAAAALMALPDRIRPDPAQAERQELLAVQLCGKQRRSGAALGKFPRIVQRR
jgi:type II secretory pathway component PulM